MPLKKEDYETLHLSSNYDSGKLDLQFEKEIGSSFESEIRRLEVVVHFSRVPEIVRVNGRKRDFNWDQKR